MTRPERKVGSWRWLAVACARRGLASLGLYTCLGTGLVCGAEPDGPDFTRPTYEFAMLPSWYSQQTLDRLPQSERLLLGLPIRREGVTPSLSIAEEYTDNTLFSTNGRSTDLITKIAPGLRYGLAGREGQLALSYGIESRLYANNTNLNRVVSKQQGDLLGRWTLSERTTVIAFNHFESFQDPTEQTLTGILPAFGRSSINIGSVSATHRVTPTVDVLASYGNFLWSLTTPGSVNSMTHEGEVGLRMQEAAEGRTTLKYRLRHFDFSFGQDFQSHTASVTQEWALSETVLISGGIGAIKVMPQGNRLEPMGHVTVKTSHRDVTFEAGYFRDVFPPSAGISQPLVSDLLRAATQVHIANGLLLDSAVGWVRTRTPTEDVAFSTIRFNLGLSYVPEPWMVVRLGYDRIQQDEEIFFTTLNRFANKVSLRITASF